MILKVKDIADILDLHPETIRNYAREGAIPMWKVKKDWFITDRKFQEYLDSRSEVCYINEIL